MGFVSRLSLATVAIIALVIGGMMLMAYGSGRDAMRAAQRSETNGVAQMIRYSMERASFFALAKAEMVARQQDVIQAIATRDRPALVDRLGDTFAYLRAEVGVEVMQFHQADFRVLVRLQDPRRYGDDVSMDRPMVVAAASSRRSQRGLELGPTGYLALRGAVPMMRDQTFLGVAEIGVAVNSLLQSVKQATGAEVGVVLSNAMTTAGAGGGNEVTVRGSTNAALFAALTVAPGFRMARETIHLEISLDGTRHAVVVEPLLDFSGRMIGAVVGAVSVDGAARAFNREMLVLLFTGIAGIIVAFSLLWVVIMAFLVRPIETLTTHAEKLAAGDGAAALPPIGGVQLLHRAQAAVQKLAQAAKRP
jgi:hypothetical protein